MEQLKERGFHLASRCPFCGKSEETLEHIMIHYPLIWDLWAIIFSSFDAIRVRPFLVRDLLSSWGNGLGKKPFRFLWRAVPLCLLWATWKERNIVVFEDTPFSLVRLKLSFSSTLQSWVGLLPNVDLTAVRILLCFLLLCLGASSVWGRFVFCLPPPFFGLAVGCLCILLV